MSFQVKKNYRSELQQIDWDFTGANGSEGFAAYHWYPARYVPQLSGILINYFSAPGATVLDPFCGSGTTLLEAYKSGRRAIGIDLNPIAAVMSRAKLVSYSEVEFDGFHCNIVGRAQDLLLVYSGSPTEWSNATSSAPNYVENSTWYHADTLRELVCLWSALAEHQNSNFYPIGLAAFSSILRGCSSQDKHWGWICDNVKPKSMTYKRAFQRFSEKIVEHKRSAIKLQREALQLQDIPVLISEIQVYEADCRHVLNSTQTDSIDLVVTSPPYYNMTDYMASQRLSLLWLEYDASSTRHQEIGARYKRFRKTSLTEYLQGMRHSFLEIQRVLKSGHYCCVVIGESPRHAPFLNELELIWGEVGLNLEDCLSRKIAKRRSLSPVLCDESIYILRKP